MPPPKKTTEASFSSASPVKKPILSSTNDDVSGPVIVIDLGAFETKVTLSDKIDQIVTFPTVVACPLSSTSSSPSDIIVGDQAIKKCRKSAKKGSSDSDSYVLRYPIQRGLIMDWLQIEAILSFAFESIGVKDPSVYPVLIGLPGTMMPNDHIESIAELLFEIFRVKHVYFELPNVMSFRGASPKNSFGLAVESGSALTYVTPIVDGKPQYGLTHKFTLAGQDATKYAIYVMSKTGFAVDPADEYRVAQHIKTNMAYTCKNLKAEFELFAKNPAEFKQELEMSGEKMALDKECFLIPEIMFEPGLAGITQAEVSSLPFTIFEAAKLAADNDLNLLGKLLSNIVIGGGNLLFNGMAERIETEVKSLVTKSKLKANVKVVASRKEDALGVVVGGATWSDKAVNDMDWLTRNEYKQSGVSKFFK
ncbi:hypothetical protein FDP41_003775 [Naegleria fowleri]|uniref:Uncharacterized protein n=1 Tax=Naegleria fowleri TaxID=5763 RepID=A0A6A5BQY6_NAEFO|nr:uncharacterized protein FDP41_003775 [Naegleria fowleri]KAF0977122.1 hypothetical protein FDP41_003775 [Naegleria fowleri]CAG4708496.1 unnamed protein product [Naegleria fowleri]